VTACNTETLDLTIAPSANNTTVISACDTYTWPVDGNTYTSSGTYTFVTACNTETLDLTITPSTNNITVIVACDTYTWPVDGNTYTTTGTYTFVTACNTETLDLTITPSANNTTIIAACDNYTWPVDGNTYTVSGTYTFVNGCNTETLDLTINISPASVLVNAQVCLGQSFTLPDGSIVNTAGTYPVTLVNSVGCDSLVTTNLSILPLTLASVNISSSPQGAICQGEEIMFIATPINGGTTPAYQWFVNGVVIPLQTNDTLLISTLNNNDTVFVQMTSNDPCVSVPMSSSNQIVQLVSPLLVPSVNIVYNPSGVQCSGVPLTFMANTQNGGANPVLQWYLNGNPVGTNLPFYTDSLLNNGDSIFVTLASSELCISDSLVFSNSIFPAIGNVLISSVTLVPSDTLPSCEGSSLTFNAIPVNGGVNPVFEWFVNGLPILGVSGDVFITSNLNIGDIISVQMISSLACANPDSALSNSYQPTILPVQIPSISISFSPAGVQCSSVPVTFTASPANGGIAPLFQWYVNGVPVPGQNSTVFVATGLNNGDLVSAGMVSNAPCSDTNQVFSNVIPLEIIATLNPSITITADRLFICEKQAINFIAIAGAAGSLPLYNWFLNGQLIQSSQSPLFYYDQFNDQDVVSCQLVSSYVCVTNDTVSSNLLTVNVNPLPYINMVHEYTSFVGDSVQLVTEGSTENIQYSWSPTLYLDCPNCMSPISMPYDPMVYYVTYTDTLTGCFVTDSLIINLNTEIEIFIPSGFSPNGDGFNDVLYVRGYNVVDFVLRVYDRYGELVFQTQSFSSGWDGTYKGKEVNAGVYYYYFDYNVAQKPQGNLVGNESLSKKGSITLIR
jgi:gliding motility-associated-like protein